MIFNIPGTCFGWWSDGGAHRYLVVDAVLAAAYCGIWAVCFRRSSVFRALALSIIPSVLFFVQRDHEPVGAADRGGGAVRAEPYPPLLSERKVKNPTGLR